MDVAHRERTTAIIQAIRTELDRQNPLATTLLYGLLLHADALAITEERVIRQLGSITDFERWGDGDRPHRVSVAAAADEP